MEFLEFDIKHKIQELLKNRIIENSVELDCEIVGSPLNRVYGTNVYYHDEVNGFIIVEVDFHCILEDSTDETIHEKGTFRGKYNVEHKFFEEDENSVTI